MFIPEARNLQRKTNGGGDKAMSKQATNDPDYELWWLILHVRRGMRRLRERDLFQYGLTPEKAAVLFVVQMIGKKATPAEIARSLLREPHSISALLSRMETEGLIKKVKDLEQKNRIRISLTPKGRRANRQAAKRDSIHEIMSCLSEEERRRLRSPLEKLCRKALEELRCPHL
jgi:DNA-binding MarR family transcriptional regulator